MAESYIHVARRAARPYPSPRLDVCFGSPTIFVFFIPVQLEQEPYCFVLHDGPGFFSGRGEGVWNDTLA